MSLRALRDLLRLPGIDRLHRHAIGCGLEHHLPAGSTISIPARRRPAPGRAVRTPDRHRRAGAAGAVIASTLSSTSRRAAFRAAAGSPRSSSITMRSGRPLMPPESLIVFSSIFAVFASGTPSDEASPVTEKIAPIT
jgi:hypothetical protein